MNLLRRAVLIPALALLAVTGCAPSLRVNVLEPSRVNLGAGKQLTVLQTEGRRSAREFVIQELGTYARQGGYYQVRDRSEEGITMKVAGRSVEFQGGTGAPLTPEEIALRIDVLDWSANSDSHTDKKGRTSRVWRAKVAAGGDHGEPRRPRDAGRDRVRGSSLSSTTARAAGASSRPWRWRRVLALGRLMRDITPSYVTKHIRLDEDDKAQQPILEVAKQGNVTRAIDELRVYLEQNQGNAVAHYNLAAMLDATSQYDEALSLYTKAIQLGSKDYYVQMKAECARRQAASAALSE